MRLRSYITAQWITEEMAPNRETQAAYLPLASSIVLVMLSSSALWARSLILAVVLTCSLPLTGADLKAPTLDAWNAYMKNIKTQEERPKKDIYLDPSQTKPAEARTLCDDRILVWPASEKVPVEVPSGLIHDWSGAMFVPGTNVEQLLKIVRAYDDYPKFYHPYVVASQAIATTESVDDYSVTMANRSAFSKGALRFRLRTSYVRVDNSHWYSNTESTEIQEIANYGKPTAHALPADHGTGLIWRLHTTVRFEERDGGVYVEMETIALSRDIPGPIRWIVEPIVRRISRSSLTNSLRQTREAVGGQPGTREAHLQETLAYVNRP